MAREQEKTAPEEELLVLHEKWVRAARDHLREIVIASVALVLVAALWSGVRYYFQRQENRAALLYAQAVMTKDEKRQEAAYREILDRYGGTTAALEARLGLYELYLSRGDREAAQKELARLRKEARAPWRAFLDLGVGYFREEAGQYREALGLYESAVKEEPGLGTVAYLDLARAAELAGDYRRATGYYEKFVGLAPQGEVLDFVQVRLAKLAEEVSSASGDGGSER